MESSQTSIGRLVLVSNRLPVRFTQTEEGDWVYDPAAGGLVTALAPVLQRRGGLWCGWTGIEGEVPLEKAVSAFRAEQGYDLRPVSLSEEEVNLYYHGFSNEIIWPLFHDLQSLCNFDPAYWHAYEAVNGKFAEEVSGEIGREDFVWVHDYHLVLLARELRALGVRNRIAFFLHTPFPPLDVFIKLPWRREVLRALLDYDLLGFQTVRDRNNFLYCLEALVRNVRHDARRQVSTVVAHNRAVRVGSFPISIDYRDFAKQASDEAVVERAEALRQAVPDWKIILGVDRLDHSKGLPQKLLAFRWALDNYEDLYENVTLVQVVVPSPRGRTGVSGPEGAGRGSC